MTLDRIAVIVLFGLAAAFPILGIALAISGLRKRQREMRDAHDQASRLHADGLAAMATGADTDYQTQIDAITDRAGVPRATNTDVLMLHLSIASTSTQLAWPAAIRDGSFVALGLIAGAAASIWALFLPPW